MLSLHGLLRMSVCFVLLFPLKVEAASITIDPGHSPRQPGAISCSGKPEYLFNEALSADIVKRLKKDGTDVRLSRAPGAEASLAARAYSSTGTDLLLAIHHDSVQPQFIVNRKRGNCSNKAAGFSIFVSAINPYYKKSLMYAQRLGQALVSQGLKPALHHAEEIPGENRKLLDKTLSIYQFDDLQVLKKCPVPAVLLEAAVIVNPEDELKASTDAFRSVIAKAVSEVMRLQ